MTSHELLAFSGALFLMVIAPGPGVLACVSRALASGFKMAAFVAVGIMIGDMFFLLMAIAGLSVIAEHLGSLFYIIRYCGAAYLIWLGYRTWTSKAELRSSQSRKSASPKSCLLSGLSITLGNPKAIAFYLSFLPAFIDIRRMSGSDVLITAGIIILTLTVVLLSYSYAANRVRDLFSGRNAVRRLNRCAGAVMASVGLAIAVKE
ncbi:MAG: LysE family translocator [Candidatus Zixiibacteriota bacterium]|nr:MAG: LysE family translocator [candidate division Zixibacteria bacterium]